MGLYYNALDRHGKGTGPELAVGDCKLFLLQLPWKREITLSPHSIYPSLCPTNKRCFYVPVFACTPGDHNAADEACHLAIVGSEVSELAHFGHCCTVS